ncbi:hypothetical protein [Paracidovorax anthurii]|uniref:hypothetical protein n=1 Tax=Paracidovorax anthurii TaxID=78229 RepID=UPI0039EEB2BE
MRALFHPSKTAIFPRIGKADLSMAKTSHHDRKPAICPEHARDTMDKPAAQELSESTCSAPRFFMDPLGFVAQISSKTA